MPSLLDHLEPGDAEPSVPPPEVLSSVKVEGRRRRVNRRRRNLGLAVALVAMLVLPVAVLRGGDDGAREDVAVTAGEGALPVELAPDPDPNETPASIVEVPAPAADLTAPTLPVVPPASAPATTVAPTATTATTGPATMATTKPACRNSDEPSCGPFRWDPVPAPNRPLVASFSKVPATAVAGATVTFEVTWSDPDARLTFDRFSTDGTGIASACELLPRYGPWTPPAAAAGSGTIPYSTTFATAGSYLVTVSLGTADCTSPYASEKSIEVIIVVAPA